MPSFEDADVEDTVILGVDLGSLSNFAAYDSTNKVITILDLNASSTQIGNHEVKLTLDDGKV